MKLLAFMFLPLIFVACKEGNPLNAVSSRQGTAESVYLTHDENDHPVVVWTERDHDQLSLFYSISTDQGDSFKNIIALPLTSDVATHAESMPKVAFRKDGTVVAAYEKKSPMETNKYAGSIYYRMSSDKGQTWTAEAFLHSDTIAGRSRSYFDIERLPNGDIGASWLDIKLNIETGGRSVLLRQNRWRRVQERNTG